MTENKRPEIEQRKVKARASVIFSLEDEQGKSKEYLGLLDTGRPQSLVSRELVKKHRLKNRE